MSVDKLVDSTQLDADLTSVANAIRTKGSTSADLAFPAGFVSAINAIPAGGGDTVYYGSEGAPYVKNMVITSTKVNNVNFNGCEELESISAPNATSASAGAGGQNCAKLQSVSYPVCTSFANYFIRQQGNQYSTLESVQIGSIGHPVASLPGTNWRYGSHAVELVTTIYVNAATLADIPSAVSNYASGNNAYAPAGSTVTVVYRNSTTGEVITS